MMAKTEIVGMKELERAFRELGKVPQTAATQSALAGARIARRAAKKNAVTLLKKRTGSLQRGIILKRERKKVPGKAVYDVIMDPAMNNVFVKISKSGKRAYYPASLEYGFLTRNGRYVQGRRFMRRAVDDNDAEIRRKVIEVASKAVEKAWQKKGR